MADFLPLHFGRGGGRQQGGRQQGGRQQGGRQQGGRQQGGGRRGGGREYMRGGRGLGRGRGGRGRGRGGGRNFQQGPPRDYDISNDVIEELGEPSANSLNIAIEGCCHGELDRIYDRLLVHEAKTGQKVDLLLCCGDFQAHRNPADFHSSSIPPKFRSLGTFPMYYSGEKKAPILTIFIGGNHEASQPLRELYYGGWVAPNIYYLGTVGMVRFGGLRIGGISGIYKSHDYNLGHFERPPFDNSSLRSVYHVRNVDIYRLKCLEKTKNRVDIMVSHDWPLGIEQHGDTEGLLRRKPFFREEVQRNDLGSRPNREVLDTIKPKWWFSAHLHVKFKATVTFQKQQDSPPASDSLTSLVPSQINTTKASLKSISPEVSIKTEERLKEEETVSAVQEEAAIDTPTTEFHSLESNNPCAGKDLTDQMTQFLALDKCLPRRQYLSILHVPVDVPKEEVQLEYDLEWLAILRKTHKLTSKERRRIEVPSEIVEVSESDIEWVQDRLKDESVEPTLTIPDSFSATVPSYSHPMFRQSVGPLSVMGNPQTDKLFKILELDHVLTVPYSPDQSSSIIPAHLQGLEADLNPDENEIDIDEDNDAEEDENEIDIDDLIESGDGSGCGGGASTKEEVRANSDLLGADDNEIDIDSMSANSPTENLEDIGAEGQHVGEGDIPAPLKKPRIDG